MSKLQGCFKGTPKGVSCPVSFCKKGKHVRRSHLPNLATNFDSTVGPLVRQGKPWAQMVRIGGVVVGVN